MLHGGNPASCARFPAPPLRAFLRQGGFPVRHGISSAPRISHPLPCGIVPPAQEKRPARSEHLPAPHGMSFYPLSIRFLISDSSETTK